MAEPIDYVFASEQYGFDLAQALSARFFPVDPARQTFPVSASSIRDNPYQHWRFIPAIVRPYFMRHVVLINETAHARALADELNTVLVAPYAQFWRYTWSHHHRRVAHEALTEEEIAQGTRASQEVLAQHANGVLIYDVQAVEALGDVPRIDLVVVRDTLADSVRHFFDHSAPGSTPPLVPPNAATPTTIRRILTQPESTPAALC